MFFLGGGGLPVKKVIVTSGLDFGVYFADTIILSCFSTEIAGITAWNFSY